MRLPTRLLLATTLTIAGFVAFGAAAVGTRADDAERAATYAGLRAEAALAARLWAAAPARGDAQRADVRFADSVATLLGRHVTLVDPGGRVRGDSDARDADLRDPGASWLAGYQRLPEVAAAARDSTGSAHTALSSATGEDELAAAARGARGVVRVAATGYVASPLASALRRGVLLAGLAALLLGDGAALLVARSITRPLAELRDAARSLAAGDLSNRPALAAPGEVGEVAAAVRRVAEQLGARLDALAAEQELLGTLTESLGEGVVAVDGRGQVVRVNDTARRLLRLPDAPPFAAEYLPRDRALREALAGALRGELVGGEPGAGSAVELRVQGRTLALTARPLPGARGAVLAFRDLTDVRRLETVRRDFVANVSHELKTPLTVVGGFAETLADDPGLAPAPRRFAETIRANAARMQRLVDDLLDLSRIESGGWRPAPAAVDVRDAAADALGPARDAAAARGVALDVVPAPDAPALYADPTAARQVLSNLVENAVRHTPAGRVTVYTRRDEGAGGVWLGVRDTGVGIAAAHLPRIFERFYRADPGRAREQGGTGLGLSIVKHLVEAHGGEVRAASVPGEGTTIEARFPAGPAAGLAAAGLAPPGVPPAT
ncbi:hypothetical protein tb265_03430 [Gemmatimonadetes bacterium T265]|nr:hypothetical protein tb265_03430 [Gemmatimonadetes bacterium T265]